MAIGSAPTQITSFTFMATQSMPMVSYLPHRLGDHDLRADAVGRDRQAHVVAEVEHVRVVAEVERRAAGRAVAEPEGGAEHVEHAREAGKLFGRLHSRAAVG